MTGEDFAAWLRRERKRAGLSQARLAEMLLVGKNTVSRWETGAQEPPAARKKAVENLFSGASQADEVTEPRAGYGDSSSLVRLSPDERRIIQMYRWLLSQSENSE